MGTHEIVMSKPPVTGPVGGSTLRQTERRWRGSKEDAASTHTRNRLGTQPRKRHHCLRAAEADACTLGGRGIRRAHAVRAQACACACGAHAVRTALILERSNALGALLFA